MHRFLVTCLQQGILSLKDEDHEVEIDEDELQKDYPPETNSLYAH